MKNELKKSNVSLKIAGICNEAVIFGKTNDKRNCGTKRLQPILKLSMNKDFEVSQIIFTTVDIYLAKT
uniref:Uncharacterized protein n=1 Tax=Onchocerca volvulus TaxID=6282 RepID=A0A8R1Y0P0_ONCVO